MARFAVPPQRPRSVLQVDSFYGVDYTSNPGDVSPGMSPNAPNMIRDVPGKVRKSMGYYRVGQYPGAINGYHRLNQKGTISGFIHAGTALYPVGKEETPRQAAEQAAPPAPIYQKMADRRSVSWQFGDRLFILDGADLLVCDGTGVCPVQQKAYIPTLTIARAPSGGGREYEPLNLIQPRFTEKFAGTEGDVNYCLTFGGLDADPVQVSLLNGNGGWDMKKEGTDFKVNRASGVITFTKAPGKSPVTGEDNVKITAARTVTGYADRIRRCRFGVRFGINGAADRLFLSGNPDWPNRDWFSGQNDPTYWPDTGYSVLGSDRSAIMGYSIVNNLLAAHKDHNETDRNVVIRRGDLLENRPSFPIVNTLQGPGAAAPFSFAYLGTEPVFLTGLGVYAITPSDISGERYSQNRSYYVNGALCREPGLEEAFALVHKDLYWLCLNGAAYILDGLQKIAPSHGEPYSTRQYACFYRTNLPARVLWEQNGILCFGSEKGDVYAFYNDPNALESYSDCGQPIHAIWETPDLSGHRFYHNKSFRSLAVRLSSAVATGLDLYGLRRGIWVHLRSEERRARYFSYRQLVYSKFTYSCDRTNRTLATKIRLKKLDKTRFRFENDHLNEPFGLMAWAAEYVENGTFKG